MTAEIAILNRTAVALAADSIVTLSGPGGSRTYDSAEKIFELSNFQPIGLMIYNNAKFVNAPLEIIARRFRETLTEKQFTSLLQVWPTFERFLLHFPRNLADECSHLESLLDAEFSNLREAQFNDMLRNMPWPDEVKERIKQQNQFYLKTVKERRKELKQIRIPDFLPDKTLEDFSETYGHSVTSLALVAFEKPPAALIKELIGLAFDVVRSSTRSEAYTGFVIAGFGEEDIFPSLYHVMCDGIYFEQLRIVGDREVTDIDRRGEQATIKAFAQTDMPERFIDGIDRQFENQIKKMLNNMVANLVQSLINPDDDDLTQKIKNAIGERIDDGINQLKQFSRQELSSVVAHLSKKELAEFSYSLVELTSHKRRYSSQQETVGGPIDVAILTRNEGFIWVRRKHYFDANLNPRYQERNQT